MSGESDDLDRLAQSIADGASINWDEIDKLPADARLRRLFALLQMVDEVAEVHRTLGDPSQPTAPDDSILPATPVAAPADGESVGQWGHLVLLRKIGEGGFGEVFHAHDTWLDHPVALKLFKPKVTSRESANRILHEARKLARIRHPNIVTVHGADSHSGQVGFWMDLIEGTTLEHIVRAGRLSAGEAAYIGQEVCRALAAVHLAGIVHRDVKAQNVMRTTDGGRIILMDFGAGEFVNDPSKSSRKQGTPLYLAPEVLAGEDASVQSDIYAVGVLLYFLVCGTYPVRAPSVAELINAHKRNDRRRLRDGRPDLPNAFVSIVERALDPSPARRFASAGDMEASLAGGSIEPAGPIDITRFHKSNESRTFAQSIGLGGLITAVVLIAAEFLGLIASRVFEVAMGIEPEFAAGPFDYLSHGARALFPFGVFWTVCAGATAMVAGVWPLFRRPFDAVRRRSSSVTRAVDSETIAALVFLAGVACWAAITWWCRDLFVALEALRVGASGHSGDVAILGSSAGPLHRTHAIYSASLSFLLGFAILRLFPRIEKDAADPSRVRLLRWGTVVVAVLTVAMAITPRRFIWENFEVVAFENQRAFVIGSNREELLLYYAYNENPKHQRVRATDPLLRRTGARARIFDP